MAKQNRSNSKILRNALRYKLAYITRTDLLPILIKIAYQTVSAIDSITSIPRYTGNLRDSHGVGLYLDGRLYQYLPTKTATKPQRFKKARNIWGTEYLQKALEEATTTFSTGIWLVVFAAVPYAAFINETHANAGFFEEISNAIVANIDDALKAYFVK